MKKEMSNMKHIIEVISEAMAEEPKPIKTGIKGLDELIGGYYPGELTTVCGRENVGKTAFIVHQVNRMAIDLGLETYMYTSYANERVWLSMMAAYYCGIQTGDLHAVLYSPMYADAVKEYLEKLKEAPLFVEFGFKKAFSLEHVMDVIKREHVKIAFFDDAMWLGDDGTTLKRLAVECGIPVVATTWTWLNGRDSLEGHRVFLTDLTRDTGCYGSDVVIGMMDFEADRIFVDDNGRDLRGAIEMEVLKHKGKQKQSRLWIDKSSLYAREHSKEKRELILNDMVEQNPRVSSSMSKLGLRLGDSDDVSLN